MIMKTLASFALLGFVSAAELPQFSATDDYDELNLNIRLLQSNATDANATNATAEPTHVVKFSAAGTVTTPNEDCPSLAADTVVTSAMAGACQTMLSSLTATAEVNCGRRLSDKRRLAALDVTIDFEAGFASAAAANAAAATVNDASAFASAFGDVLGAALSALGSEYGVSGLTTTAATVSEASDSPTPASPSPASKKDASNASMLKANVALIAVASVASFFF